MAVRHDCDPKALMKAKARAAANQNRGLTPRIKKAIELMVFGGEDGTIYTSDRELAAAAGLRSHRTIWEAMNKPVVAAYYQQQFAAKKNGLRALGLRTIEEVMTDPELKKTATGARARTDAAKVVLVEPAGAQVNVQVNNSTHVTPGYVIKLTRNSRRGDDAQLIAADDVGSLEGR